MADVELSRLISAAPEQLYALVSDVTRMGEWSDENTGAVWKKGSGPAVGSVFVGKNELDGKRWATKCKVTDATPGDRFAFEVKSSGFPIARWEYQFEAVEGGTKVTERWTDRRNPMVKVIGKLISGSGHQADHTRASIDHTLGALEAAATAP